MLFVLFIGFLVIFLYHYFYTGEFGIEQLGFVLVILAALIAVFFISKWQKNKDRSFQPETTDIAFKTRLGERVASGEKQIFLGENHVGTYFRFYDKGWKRFIAGLARNPGLWYLNLQFNFSNGDAIVIKGVNETKLYGNSEWIVYKNDQVIGEIRTDLSVKNAKRLREKLEADLDGKKYQLQSRALKSDMEIFHEGSVIAAGRRLDTSIKSLYQLNVDELPEEEAYLLFAVYILFNYYFG
ncbi:hypothetical protein MM300_10565 [Evansella sp. LMS18]|jgi:hypothetical protein|uniref:tubby C-terminal domain-like protein n=1 Tax=Evansella sp. LMS18 TaxID=2924033 RepID=UPI0020D01BD1|nr:hypothetical protein [Evansella sp. LMS18]UTR12677.1 hypothetical protein MM300_10565 [Evansella sp. LMS18]